MQGKVYIVGAGPGDIGLFTIKGLKYLRKAEVVIYDFHLNAQILNYVNHDAELIYAGKRGGKHTMTQDEINRVLVEKAKEGKIICRLKGGDPFVFGRGGEEAEVLSNEGIDFDIVPGVSSAIAAPAYAGIPLTHRLYSSSVAIVPGYEDSTKKESSIDWSKIATGVGTIVFLMAVKNIEAVCRRLIENGRDPDTPVAVIRWGTRAEQKTVVSSLKDISRKIKERDIKPPAVMVVGDVVRLREKLNWFEKKPLFGQRILVTREHSEGFEPLEELGAEIMEFPTIKITPPPSWTKLDKAISKIESYHWLIFTSVNGVKYFFLRFLEKDRDIRDLKDIKICAIGSKTKTELKKYGLNADLVPKEFNAEGLIQSFKKLNKSPDLKGLKFLLPRAETARELLPEKIRELGGEIHVVPAYVTVNPQTHGKRLRRFLQEGKITMATFTSASTFNNFLSVMVGDVRQLLKNVAIAAIGPVTAKAIKDAGLHVNIISRRSTVDSLVMEIMSWLANKPLKCNDTGVRLKKE